jgi:hypothetical protein
VKINTRLFLVACDERSELQHQRSYSDQAGNAMENGVEVAKVGYNFKRCRVQN